MKKMSCVLLAIVLHFVAASCANGPDPEAPIISEWPIESVDPSAEPVVSEQPNENTNVNESRKEDLSKIAIDQPLDLEVNPGPGVVLAYESEDKLIFYGEFGLFGYDLNEKEYEFTVDFVKAVGIQGTVQGSHGTAVVVTADGKTIVIFECDSETGERGTACYIDIPSQTYYYGEYQEPESVVKRENHKGYIFTGMKIREVKYVLDDREWLLFE